MDQKRVENFRKYLIYTLIYLFGVLCGVGLQRAISNNALSSNATVLGVEDVNTVKSSDGKATSEQLSQKDCEVYVDVSGAVKIPGVYCLKKDSRIVNAIRSAGGVSKDQYAQKYVARKLNLASPLVENMKIYIPFQAEMSCNVVPFSLEAQKEIDEIEGKIEDGGSGEQEESGVECVSLNSATISELKTLKGVGDSTAIKIVDGRPYKKIEDLMNVSGIGQATFDSLKEGICL